MSLYILSYKSIYLFIFTFYQIKTTKFQLILLGFYEKDQRSATFTTLRVEEEIEGAKNRRKSAKDFRPWWKFTFYQDKHAARTSVV